MVIRELWQYSTFLPRIMALLSPPPHRHGQATRFSISMEFDWWRRRRSAWRRSRGPRRTVSSSCPICKSLFDLIDQTFWLLWLVFVGFFGKLLVFVFFYGIVELTFSQVLLKHFSILWKLGSFCLNGNFYKHRWCRSFGSWFTLNFLVQNVWDTTYKSPQKATDLRPNG